jgi:hypothetical protein
VVCTDGALLVVESRFVARRRTNRRGNERDTLDLAKLRASWLSGTGAMAEPADLKRRASRTPAILTVEL